MTLKLFCFLCSVIEQLGGKQLVMQLLAHEDPNVRYESLLAVQKLMVHNWYAAQYFVTYGFLIYFLKQGILGQTIGKGYQARFGELVGRCQDQRLKGV